MRTKYIVRLTKREQGGLLDVIKQLQGTSQKDNAPDIGENQSLGFGLERPAACRGLWRSASDPGGDTTAIRGVGI